MEKKYNKEKLVFIVPNDKMKCASCRFSKDDLKSGGSTILEGYRMDSCKKYSSKPKSVFLDPSICPSYTKK